MVYKTKIVFTIEDHPFGPFIPKDAEKLIVGTFPTFANNSLFQFYYGSRENVFWRILEMVYNHSFTFQTGSAAIEERRNFLTSKRIGITDMLLKCYRKNQLSTDENLYPIILTDIFSELHAHTSINKLILTSRTPVVGALGLLQTYFLQRGKVLDELTTNYLKVKQGSFWLNEKEFKIFVPYSPSPRLIKEGRTSLAELVNMYDHSLMG